MAYYDCLWTGVALHEFTDKDGNDGHPPLAIEDGEPATPQVPSYRNAAIIRIFKRSMAKQVEAFEHPERLICNRWKHNCVPIKLVKDEENMPQSMIDLCDRESRDNLRHWQPADLLKQNIGSNKGLMKVLLTVLPEIHPDNPDGQVHKVLNSDCQIFVRIAKVTARSLIVCFRSTITMTTK